MSRRGSAGSATAASTARSPPARPAPAESTAHLQRNKSIAMNSRAGESGSPIRPHKCEYRNVPRIFGSDLGRAKLLLYAFIIVAAIGFGWLAAESYSVYKLTRGVGDTWFYASGGRKWFRLDDQRHDVSI